MPVKIIKLRAFVVEHKVFKMIFKLEIIVSAFSHFTDSDKVSCGSVEFSA